MKRWLYIVALCSALLLLAVAGWAADGVRYGLTGSRRRALAPS
jgi:hypothetical protein